MKNQSINPADKCSRKTSSRREFIGKIMLASAGASLLSFNKPSWQLGAFTRPWANYDYRVAFDGMAEAGFKFAGLMSSDKGRIITAETSEEKAFTIGEEAERRGLKINSAYSSIDVSHSIASGINGMQRIIDNLHRCRCSNLVLGGIGNPKLVEDYYKVIAESCDYAAEKGVFICIKPHGGPNATGKGCKTIMEKVNNRNFGIWYDPGNIFFYSDGDIDPVVDSREVDGMVVGISIKDFSPPKMVDLTPGEGIVDFSKVLANLYKGGFSQGPLMIECLSTGDLDFINSEALKTRFYLEKIIGEL